MSRTHVLLALTSHDRLGDTGEPTGFYVPEAAHPWRLFTDAGFEVDLVSPAGGTAPQDGADDTDPVQRDFLADPRMSAQLAATPRPADLDATRYDAIFYVGGHGVMWDFPGDTALAGIAADVYRRGGVVAAVCHGPAGLLDVVLADGRHLVEGREVASFTNGEEAAAGKTDVVPFLLQTALEERGAKHSCAADFSAHVVVDGRLITGQNPASAVGVAEAVIDALR